MREKTIQMVFKGRDAFKNPFSSEKLLLLLFIPLTISPFFFSQEIENAKRESNLRRGRKEGSSFSVICPLGVIFGTN